MSDYQIRHFVAESNKIEDILRAPLQKEIDIHRWFVELPFVGIPELIAVVSVLQPDAVLREHEGLDVYVGNHTPPSGGADVPKALDYLLSLVGQLKPFQLHCNYERLHPFTDGNGRSGRLLWLWHMKQCGALQRALQLGFLHTFYYQTLEANDDR